MGDQYQDEGISGEVNSRLDDLFGEDTKEAPDSAAKAGAPPVDPIWNLKSIVLSIEWEINDDVMNRFVDEVGALKNQLADDRILVLFLQLMGSLGEYIRSNKGGAHPNSFRLLNQVFEKFEGVYRSGDDLSGNEKKKILSSQLNQFKELKEQIAERKVAARTPRDDHAHPVAEEEEEAASGGAAVPVAAVRDEAVETPARYITQDAFQRAVEEIKETLRAEVRSLRDEIRELLGGK